MFHLIQWKLGWFSSIVRPMEETSEWDPSFIELLSTLKKFHVARNLSHKTPDSLQVCTQSRTVTWSSPAFADDARILPSFQEMAAPVRVEGNRAPWPNHRFHGLAFKGGYAHQVAVTVSGCHRVGLRALPRPDSIVLNLYRFCELSLPGNLITWSTLTNSNSQITVLKCTVISNT